MMRGEQDLTFFHYRLESGVARGARIGLEAMPTGLNIAVRNFQRHTHIVSVPLAQRDPVRRVSMQAVVHVNGMNSRCSGALPIGHQRMQ